MSTLAKKRRARGSLSSQEILEAAKTEARAGNQISVRHVAKRLGSSAMAIYTYFPSQADLCAALADQELGQVDARREGSWDDNLRRLAVAHASFLEARPWLLPLLFDNPAPGPSTMKLGEKYLEILDGANLEPEMTVAAFTGLIAIIYGRAGFTAGRIARPLLLPSDSLPHSSTNHAHLANFGMQENFDNVIEIYITGIKALQTGSVRDDT